MKNLLYTLLFTLVQISTLCAQSSLYDTYPLCGQKNELQSFANEYNLGSKQDSILYLLHFQVGACPRCEGLVPILYDRLPPKARKVIMIDGITQAELVSFLQANVAYAGKDIKIDQYSQLKSIVSHKNNRINVPYLYKIDLKNKVFIRIIPLLGVDMNTEFVASIVQSKDTLACKSAYLTDRYMNNRWDTIVPIVHPTYSLGNIASHRLIKNDLWLIDNVSENVFCYTLDGKMKHMIQKDTNHIYHYAKSDFERQYIRLYKSMGVAKNIYLSILHDATSNQYLISQSLPEIILKISENNDSSIYYSNIPYFTILDSSLQMNKAVLRKIKNNDSNYLMTSSHTDSWSIDSFIIQAIWRGYPTEGVDESILENNMQNPLLDTFYTLDNTFELITLQGSKGFFGRLPELYKKLRLGYSYFNPRVATYQNNFVCTDGVSGDVGIYTLQKQGVPKEISHFTIYPEKIEYDLLDEKEYKNKLDYMEAYKPVLTNSKILATAINESTLTLLQKQQDNILLSMYTYQGKLIRMIDTDLRFEEDMVRYMLKADERKTEIIAISEKDNQTKLYFKTIYNK